MPTTPVHCISSALHRSHLEKERVKTYSTNNLPGQLPRRILPIRTKSQRSTQSHNRNRIPNHNRVIIILAQPLLSLLRLPLRLLLGLYLLLMQLMEFGFSLSADLCLLVVELLGLGLDGLGRELRGDGVDGGRVDVD